MISLYTAYEDHFHTSIALHHFLHSLRKRSQSHSDLRAKRLLAATPCRLTVAQALGCQKCRLFMFLFACLHLYVRSVVCVEAHAHLIH